MTIRPGITRIGVLLIAAFAIAAFWACPRSFAYEHRRGIPSVGGQLQMGYLGVDSDWTDTFEWSKGGTIRVRQYLARDRAIGFSFEQQKFDRIDNLPPDNPTFNADALQFQILMVDYYFYFNRIKKLTYYLVLSGGGYRPEIIDNADVGEGFQVEYPKENVLARIGFGLERFLTRTVSIDSSLSFYYFNAPSIDGMTGSAQLALGIHVYTGK